MSDYYSHPTGSSGDSPSVARPQSVDSLDSGVAALRLDMASGASGVLSPGSGSAHSDESGVRKTGSASGSGSGNNNNPGQSLQRKADFAYNHFKPAARPGECRVAMRRMDVASNYFRIKTPSEIKAYAYRLEFSTKGRAGWEEETKRERCDPLFWTFYQANRHIFPAELSRVVFDGVSALFSLDRLNVAGGDQTIQFPAQAPKAVPAGAPARGGGGRGGRGGGRGFVRPPPMAQVKITTNPMTWITDMLSNDETNKCSVVQLLDLVINQEMRCPLVQNASRFVQQGHSIFKVPSTEAERKMCVQPIGMGEEVWTGLHMAVKADAADCLYLNASTSGAIFHSARLNLIKFYAQVVRGYVIPETIDSSSITLDPYNLDRLSELLKGTKVRYVKPGVDNWGVKKFEKFSRFPATKLFFDFEGRKYSVAEYYARIRDIRLSWPEMPCLSFFNKVTRTEMYIPMELCETHDEPRKFKGKLSDAQLNAFIKAAGMGPVKKRQLIETLSSPAGTYLGAGQLAKEWGVEVEREMVEIKDAIVLRYPDMQWKDRISKVNHISAEYTLCDDDETATPRPRGMIEPARKSIALVMVFVNGDGAYEAQRGSTELFAQTLRAYGLDVMGPAWLFQNLINNRDVMNIDGLRAMIDHWKNEIKTIGLRDGKEFTPLFMFVFPRRNELLYSCIKYTCDVEKGVLSQVILQRTFSKFSGNAVTNTSAQNVLLKVLAKAGGAPCRIDGNQFKNVGKMTSEEEATLVLGIDVSHPSREERMAALARVGATPDHSREANKQRGRHQQLPTARPAAAAFFKEFSYYDCPRSVVSVVGNVDLHQTKWGVSSRVQRLGQEETVNLVEPFRARIEEFHRKTGAVPKHVIVYRDGISDSMFKKAAYEETEALERALEALSIEVSKVTITYIVAKKRHHTRFFASDPNMALDLAGNRGANCPPGLLVEKTITSRNTFDFFLQSHYGNLGTAAPTHYTVLRDDWAPSTSFWQTIVFGHCFGNARCTRPLSIPVPLHYAHFAAKRAKNVYDHFRDYAAPDAYRDSSAEELELDQMELDAITLNKELSEIDSMYFA